MRIGVDSSILIAAMHANHLQHAVAVKWLTDHLSTDEVCVTHHAVLECYAVLTRLPGQLRVTGDEARHLIEETIHQNMGLAGFAPESIWEIMDEMARLGVVGGRAYDTFQVAIHQRNGAQAIATFNSRHFTEIAGDLRVIDPCVSENLED